MNSHGILQNFPRGLSDVERLVLHEMMAEIAQALQHQWIIYGGALIGALLCQDFLPWDDDIDILTAKMPENQNFGRFATYRHTYQDGHPMVKVFDPTRAMIPHCRYSFPFVDISTMVFENGIVSHPSTRGGFDRFAVSDVVPRRRVKFGPTLVNAPYRSERVLSEKYSPDWALTAPPATWDHRVENHTHYKERHRVPVSLLFTVHAQNGWVPHSLLPGSSSV